MGTQLSSEGLGFCYQLDTCPASFCFSLFLGDDLLPRILPFSYLNRTELARIRPISSAPGRTAQDWSGLTRYGMHRVTGWGGAP